MKQEVAHFLSAKIEWLLGKLGIAESVASKIDTLILLLLVLASTYAITEIIYRILLSLSKRILKRKRYLFLEKLAQRGRMRKQAYIMPPIILSSMLPFLIRSEGRAFAYI